MWRPIDRTQFYDAFFDKQHNEKKEPMFQLERDIDWDDPTQDKSWYPIDYFRAFAPAQMLRNVSILTEERDKQS
jgi:hypothetical protein